MALLKCPECGGKVSSTIDACPHCGYKVANIKTEPTKKNGIKLNFVKKNKKIIILGTTLVIGFSLIGGVVGGVLSAPPVKASIMMNEINKKGEYYLYYDACYSFNNLKRHSKVISKSSLFVELADEMMYRYRRYGNEINIYVICQKMDQYDLCCYTKMTKQKIYKINVVQTSNDYSEIKGRYLEMYKGIESQQSSYFKCGVLREAI